MKVDWKSTRRRASVRLPAASRRVVAAFYSGPLISPRPPAPKRSGIRTKSGPEAVARALLESTARAGEMAAAERFDGMKCRIALRIWGRLVRRAVADPQEDTVTQDISRPGRIRRRLVPASRRLSRRLGLLPTRIYQRWERLMGRRVDDVRDIPVVINSFNRLDPLLKLLEWLNAVGMRRVYILDNDSTYPPLLEFYRACEPAVVHAGRNGGPFGFWQSALYRELRGGYYIYTDPDVVPTEDCPADAVQQLYQILQDHPKYLKAGFALKLDDLPVHYQRRDEVRCWESAYWLKEVVPGLFEASIDTTFAMYRPYANGGWWRPAVRLAGPYVARHLPWYEDSSNPSEEDRYYRKIVEAGSHWMVTKPDTPKVSEPHFR